MSGREPWEYGGETPKLNLFEMIIIGITMIISAIFFRPPKKRK